MGSRYGCSCRVVLNGALGMRTLAEVEAELLKLGVPR